MSKNKQLRKQYRQFDEFFKYLLTVNTTTLLPILNYLFDTDFKVKDVNIIIENNEQININSAKGRFDKHFTDLMIAVTAQYDQHQQKHAFHIELQSRHDPTMPLRMLQYGLQYAQKTMIHDDKALIMQLPRQKVLYPLKRPSGKNVDNLELRQHDKQTFIFNYESVYVDEIADTEIREKHLGLFALFKLFNRSLETDDKFKRKAILEIAYQTIDENYTKTIKLTEVEVESMKQVMHVMLDSSADISKFKHIRKEAERIVAERHRAAAEARAEGEAEGRAEGKAKGLAEGKAKGLAEGKAKGLAEGKAKGLAEGKAKGLAEGKAEAKNQIVKNMLLDGTLTDAQIMRFTAIDQVELDRIKEMLK